MRQPKPKWGMLAAAPQAAIMGAMNEAMAFTNWPNVRVAAKRSPLMMLEMRGLSEVCIKALPMPSSENDINISV